MVQVDPMPGLSRLSRPPKGYPGRTGKCKRSQLVPKRAERVERDSFLLGDTWQRRPQS